MDFVSDATMQAILNDYLGSSGGKRKMKEISDEILNSKRGIYITSEGTRVLTKSGRKECAKTLIQYIKDEAAENSIPESVLDHIARTHIVKVDDYEYDLYFAGGDRSVMHRDSLYKEKYPRGVDNIVALLNTGYGAKDYVYGYWPGHGWARSTVLRSPTYFIQNAVERFNQKYGSLYGVVATISDEYM